MLAMEVAILKAIEERGYKPDVTAGLSLGEYGAITAAGVMSAEDVFKVVRKRGIYMQEAVPEGGAMVAVLGLDTAVIEEVCAKTEGVISIANVHPIRYHTFHTLLPPNRRRNLTHQQRFYLFFIHNIICRYIKTLNIEKVEDLEKLSALKGE